MACSKIHYKVISATLCVNCKNEMRRRQSRSLIQMRLWFPSPCAPWQATHYA